ncbi:MAG: DUF4339 domain-containing protein [Planctomycetes bacterium]|nr:DUF4339 domain-containing protein [Planctomycetota bacterium]
MGIRFECPNGHRLHVKAFLAGERGICPECDVRFIVPAESGGRAPVVEEVAVEEVAAPPETATSATAAPPLPEAELFLPEADLSLPDVWYVRTAGGSQYGPADTETMRGWVAEGRVLHDSWVWRTGWPDWKRGVEALALLNVPIEGAAAPAITLQTDPTAPIDVAAPKLRRTRRSRRRDRAKTITMALSALVLLLLVALVLVLSR